MNAELLVQPVPAVLYVGCGAADRDGVEGPLGRAGLACVAVNDRHGAIDALARRTFGVCLIDLAGNGQAMRTARAIAQEYPDTLLIGVADPLRPERTVEAMRAGFADVVARPLGGRDVEAIAAHAAERAAAVPVAREERRVRPFSVDLLGHSPSVRRLMDLLPRVARSRSPVLICAERGIDTEALARELHIRSERASGPFEHVPAIAADPARIDRELFGASHGPAGDLEHVTASSRLGAARGGTLFIEDVGELPASAQARLARVARDGEVRMDGHPHAVPLDVRLMASAGPDFDAAVREGHFRADLARRLGVVRLEPPPLRERTEDIPLLCQYFAVEVCAAAGEGLKTFTQAALTVLSALPWTGRNRSQTR